MVLSLQKANTMKRFDIIRHLIESRGYKSYLEIGVLGNETFASLPPLDVKDSVDPNGQAVYTMTSDEFFAHYCSRSYDIIFIDGLHLSEQVQRDIENSLTWLNHDGIIVVHDCLPATEEEQLREGVSSKPWTGDVWKTFARLRLMRWGLEMCVVDTDCGCGLIEFGDSSSDDRMMLPETLDWKFFEQNRNKLMNVISVEQFLNGYCK